MGKIKQKIGTGKFKTILPLLVTIIIICTIFGGLYNLNPVKLKKFDDVLNIVSELATIAGVAGVFYAIKTFKKTEEDSKQTERSELMKNSIEVLKIFSGSIIPKVEAADKERRRIYKDSVTDYKQRVLQKENKHLDELPSELDNNLKMNAKIRSGAIGILNQLEQVCAYVSHDLIIEDVVYPTVHKFFLDFCRDNDDLIKYMTSDEVPYKNVHTVKNKWNKMANKDSIERKKKKLEEDLAKLDTI